jgi:transposase
MARGEGARIDGGRSRLVAVAKYATGMNADAGRRFRRYPTLQEAERLTAWGHTCRSVWNVALAQRQLLFGQRGVMLRASQQCRHLTEARAELDWIADLPAQVGQQVLAQLDRACENWWNLRHPAGPPRFRLNRRILDNAPGERRRQLAYKAKRFGSELRLVPPAGTSQRCSACGVRDPESRPGCGRELACISCGHQEHADRNAAQNIEDLAAGRAVNSTCSHLEVARPASRMREPLVAASPRTQPGTSSPPAGEDVKASTCRPDSCPRTSAPMLRPLAGGLIANKSGIHDALLESVATRP